METPPDLRKQALIKIASFCAYQERYTREVRQKLTEWELQADDVEVILDELKAQKYLDDDRYARSFARGKFRIKRWGKQKIKQELRLRGVDNTLITNGLSEIDGDEYQETLRYLLNKKQNELYKDDHLKRQQKLLRYALSKGYENDIIWDLLREIPS